MLVYTRDLHDLVANTAEYYIKKILGVNPKILNKEVMLLFDGANPLECIGLQHLNENWVRRIKVFEEQIIKVNIRCLLLFESTIEVVFYFGVYCHNDLLWSIKNIKIFGLAEEDSCFYEVVMPSKTPVLKNKVLAGIGGEKIKIPELNILY